MSAPKWLPKDSLYSFHLFGELEQMVTTFRCLGKRFSAEINLKKTETEVNITLRYHNFFASLCTQNQFIQTVIMDQYSLLLFSLYFNAVAQSLFLCFNCVVSCLALIDAVYTHRKNILPFYTLTLLHYRKLIAVRCPSKAILVQNLPHILIFGVLIDLRANASLRDYFYVFLSSTNVFQQEFFGTYTRLIWESKLTAIKCSVVWPLCARRSTLYIDINTLI